MRHKRKLKKKAYRVWLHEYLKQYAQVFSIHNVAVSRKNFTRRYEVYRLLGSVKYLAGVTLDEETGLKNLINSPDMENLLVAETILKNKLG